VQFKADGKIAVVVRIMVKVPTLSMSSDPNAASGTRPTHTPPFSTGRRAMVGEGSTHLPFLFLVDLGPGCGAVLQGTDTSTRTSRAPR
jgi:hypothetical protein